MRFHIFRYPELMFVNKTILNEAGYDVPDEDWTWEDFYEIVKGVTGDTDGDGEYDTFGVCGISVETGCVYK